MHYFLYYPNPINHPTTWCVKAGLCEHMNVNNLIVIKLSKWLPLLDAEALQIKLLEKLGIPYFEILIIFQLEMKLSLTFTIVTSLWTSETAEMHCFRQGDNCYIKWHIIPQLPQCENFIFFFLCKILLETNIYGWWCKDFVFVGLTCIPLKSILKSTPWYIYSTDIEWLV